MPDICSGISPKMIDWLLYNLPSLRVQVAETEPRTSTSVVIFSGRNIRVPSSAVESIAIKRAAVSAVLDVVERGIKSLHPEQRRVYRMKYRAGMRAWQVACKLHCAPRTVNRRVDEIRETVTRAVMAVPGQDMRELKKFFFKD